MTIWCEIFNKYQRIRNLLKIHTHDHIMIRAKFNDNCAILGNNYQNLDSIKLLKIHTQSYNDSYKLLIKN